MAYYYVYKITNTINGKWYIGKRKHNNPHEDGYMGSGKQIKAAIKKYGKDNFIKEILAIYESNDEAALHEAALVTIREIKSGVTYNMHEGGHGGFAHINTGDADHIDRARRGGKISYRKNILGKGRKFKKDEERTKVLSEKANRRKKEHMLVNPEKYAQIYKNLSELRRTSNNMLGKIWIRRGAEQKTIAAEDYEVYRLEGWLSSEERIQIKISAMKRRWVNKDNSNRLVDADEYNAYLNAGWQPGRISNKKL